MVEGESAITIKIKFDLASPTYRFRLLRVLFTQCGAKCIWRWDRAPDEYDMPEKAKYTGVALLFKLCQMVACQLRGI